MIFKSVLFLAHLILLNIFAGKCDTYIRGAVWIHNLAGDEVGYYEGCKKGCFDNSTFTENGVQKCEKCSAIEDQQFCEDLSDNCKWTKSGKCTSTSCPDMVKNLNKADGRALNECLEGDAETQFYNRISLSLDPSDCAISTIACRKKICDNQYNDTNYALHLANEILNDLIPDYWKNNFYGSAQAESIHWRADGLQRCLRYYEGNKTLYCGDSVYKMPQRDHADTKAARKECHKIYGCMYSADNGRCSYWAVWAFVLTLVICILLVLGIFGAVFFVFKDKILGGAGTILHQN